MTDRRFSDLVKRIDPKARLIRSWPLTGGVSAEITALEIEQSSGSREKVVVRRHGKIDRAHNPRIARDEYRLLEIAQALGLAAPRPVYIDESGELFPTPVLVIEFVEGETSFEPADTGSYLDQIASQLAKIHSVKATEALFFLPNQGKGFSEPPERLDDTLSENRIRLALASVWPLTPMNDPVLLHGDYWPGNILWLDGKLAAVIDWEDARVGDPLADVGNCRLELLWALGVDAMNEFTDRYRSLTSIKVANLPYWDLVAALRPCGKLSGWDLDADTEKRMRERHWWFVDQAIDALAVR